jgi:hypothetical protein
MTGCKTLAQGRINLGWLDAAWGTCFYRPRREAVPMSKRYELVLDRIPVPGGGFIEAFRMALVDLSSFGEGHLDLSGYPHDSEGAAIATDWAAIGVDIAKATNKIAATAGDTKGGIGHGAGRPESTAGRSKKAAAG